VPKEDTQFKKGEPSRNPGGRPPGLAEFRKKLAQLDDTAFKTLKDGLTDPNGKVRMTALTIFYNRRWGKETQAVELTGAGGGPLQHFDVTKATPQQLEQLRLLALDIASSAAEAETIEADAADDVE
jgi:hypothetical protein